MEFPMLSLVLVATLLTVVAPLAARTRDERKTVTVTLAHRPGA